MKDNLVDSCGWLEYFADGKNSSFFAPIIENTKKLIVPSICLFEVFKIVYQQRGEDAAFQAIALMHQGKIVNFDDRAALYAARLSIKHSLPLADSIILAISYIYNSQIWTQDKDFEKIEGVKYILKK